MPLTAQVAVSDATVTYDKLYTYLVPALLEGHIFVGGVVLVPFGRGRAAPRIGVVAALEAAGQPDARLKPIWDAAPEDAALSEELLALVGYLREATFCTWFDAVKAVLPRGAQYRAAKHGDSWKLEKSMPRTAEAVWQAAPGAQKILDEGTLKLTEKQLRVLAFVEGAPEGKSLAEIAACGAGRTVVAALAKKGLLIAAEREREAEPGWSMPEHPDDAPAHYELSDEQRAAAGTLLGMMEGQNPESPKPALLYGVTGSGKTAVFIELARAALARGKTALVLVPEIGLTPQMAARLRAAFGEKVAIQHSGLSPTKRLAQWRAIRRGDCPVVVGTRSAVFAPLANLGLVVVDEEQERTYASETAPRYDAVEVARRRAARHGALLLLASATPSVSAYHAALQGRYGLVKLPHRYGGAELPEVEMIDMAAELLAGRTGPVSAPLAEAMRGAVAEGGQVILLLNRRGYHRVAVCRACRKRVECELCSAPMVYHRHRGQPPLPSGEPVESGARAAAGGYLLCHHCGRSQSPAPAVCPDCGGELVYQGVGTQRLEDELAEALPGARLLRMDLDTTARKGAHAAMLRRFASGDYDVLLGTQMVAKGLDFERVRLVGVIGIDSLLFSQGYRAFEQAFSLVTQVVGRSGRKGGARGRALIQTMAPGHYVLQYAAKQDYEAFFNEEIGFRKLALYPPFCALCVVGFAAAEEALAQDAARFFATLLAEKAAARPGLPLRVLGPSPMNPALLAGSYRWRLTLKCRADAAFRTLAREALAAYNEAGWGKKATAWLDFNADS